MDVLSSALETGKLREGEVYRKEKNYELRVSCETTPYLYGIIGLTSTMAVQGTGLVVILNLICGKFMWLLLVLYHQRAEVGSLAESLLSFLGEYLIGA